MIDKLENNAPFAAPKSLTLIRFIHVYLVSWSGHRRAAAVPKRLKVVNYSVTPGPIWMAHEWPMSAGARV
jgi:hypothetical protein